MNDLVREEYSKNGYLTHPGLLDSKQLSKLLLEIERISGENTLALHDKSRLEMEPNQKPEGRLVRRIYEPCAHYAAFRELSEWGTLLDVVETVLGPNVVLHYSKLNMKPPAIGSVVEWHQDLSYYPLTNDSSLAVLIYLDDADLANGCLQVIPGQHKNRLLNHTRDGYFVGKITETIDESAAIPLEGVAGTAIFMHCMTPHASIANRSDRPRRTLIVSYRAADSFPIYTGDATSEQERFVQLVRGRVSNTARFTFQEFSIPSQKKKTASLYELQDLSRT